MNSQITWELVDYLLELLDEADIPTRLSEDEYVLPAKDGWTIRCRIWRAASSLPQYHRIPQRGRQSSESVGS
jgi:hypothetical protein